jgi:hypothetical protein
MKHLVERSYLHPAMAIVLGVLAAGFFAINSGSLLLAGLVAMAITGLLLYAPVTRRIIGARFTCRRCGHRWTGPTGTAAPRLRVVR